MSSRLSIRKIAVCIVAFSVPISGTAQNFIKGSVSDSTGASVPYCAVALMNAKDSSLVKGNVTDSLGKFTFENIKTGPYFVKFSNVGITQGQQRYLLLIHYRVLIFLLKS